MKSQKYKPFSTYKPFSNLRIFQEELNFCCTTTQSFIKLNILTDKLWQYHDQYRLLYVRTNPNVEIWIASSLVPSLSGHYSKLYDHTNLITPCSRQEERLERICNSCSLFTPCPLESEDNGLVRPDNSRRSSQWFQTTRWLYSLSARGYDALLHCSKFWYVTSTEGEFRCVTYTEGLSVRFCHRRVRSSAG